MIRGGSDPPGVVVTSDASGSWGCGDWFQIPWQSYWEGVHITVKELLPVVVACAIWGRSSQGKSIRVRCDNAAVVAILRSGTSKDKLTMHLVRCLAFFRAEFSFTIASEHLPGSLNTVLSRNNLSRFFQICPTAPHSPVAIPQELIQALLNRIGRR